MTAKYDSPPEELEAPLSLDPSTWSPKDIYHLHSALIVPRPIAWVSTQSRSHVDNLAPHSYFNAIADDPPMVSFSIEGKSDTYHNLHDVPEFTVNLVTSTLAEKMEITAVSMPPDEDEFGWARLTKTGSDRITPYRVAESPAALECVVDQILSVGKRNHLVIATVVRYHISPEIWKGARVDPDQLRAIGRLAGGYVELGPRFKMHRPDFRELSAPGVEDPRALSARAYVKP